jgi:phosphotriesterase-related protein
VPINTVTGPIEPDQLGWTLPHEHIVVQWDGTELDSTLGFDYEALERHAVSELKAAKASGIDTMVDCTTIEMGRNVALMKRLSEATGVQLICITGLFADAYGIPHYFRELKSEQLTEIYIKEIQDGIGDTGVKAGAIKVSTGGVEVTPLEERIIRAAAVAQVATGVPVVTHTGRGAGGDRQIELLTEGGVPPTKIVIGHSDVSANLRYHRRLMRGGVFVGFDRIGLPAFMPDEIRAQCIAGLIRMGYLEQLTMSLDAHCAWCGRENELTEERSFTSLADDFFPLLRDAGISDEQIRHVMVDNVRKLFA